MIWRRIQVRGDTTIAELHYIIQLVMGWEDDHLNCFKINGREYSN
ncbi:MAG: plasmid pRiA4b ORF-3 family protein [Flammeovirgaceae bacterium]|nr:plasmid pRiA4b ORF-3 family protein [Flammeovirgaceae bacterium]